MSVLFCKTTRRADVLLLIKIKIRRVLCYDGRSKNARTVGYSGFVRRIYFNTNFKRRKQYLDERIKKKEKETKLWTRVKNNNKN